MTPFIGLLFFLSGAIGLGYEIVWIKILALHFGNSAWSISAVVGAFMAGLGLGSWQAGRMSSKLTRPLRAYAWLEIGIAVFGLISIPLFENADRILGPLYLLLLDRVSVFIFAQLVLAFAILIVPTFLMGASLPVLVKGLAGEQDFKKTVGFLYGINTLGAATGTLVTGFFLLPHLGIRISLYGLAAGGLVLGGLAWFSSDYFLPGARSRAKIPIYANRVPVSILTAAFVSGALGLFYEVSWSRLLTPVVGSSTYAFSMILVTFLIGIGAGSLLVAHLRVFHKSPRFSIGFLICLTALTAWASLFLINALPNLFVKLVMVAKQRAIFFFLAQSFLAGSLMFLPTLFLGMTLPLCMASLKKSGGSVEAVGRVYAINTAGSIVGSLAAGFVFLPLVGVRLSILSMSIAGVVVGLWLLGNDGKISLRARRVSFLFLAAFSVFLYVFNPALDMSFLQTGFFRGVLNKPTLPGPQRAYLLFLRDGITSTVTVFRSPLTTWLNVNGKTDASTGIDMDSQYLLAHLPLVFVPSAKTVCVIGFGSGATVNAVAGHPVEKIDVIELEPAILETAPYFVDANDNVTADPRVRIHLEDGRTFLKYRQDVYDVIISEPSNPWVAGVGSLFTVEFYRDVKKRLSPNGVFCQWIQDYELSDHTRNVMLNTLNEEFPSVHLFHQDGDLIAVASPHPLRIDPSYLERVLKRPSVQRTLNRLSISNKYDLFVGYLASFPEDRLLYAASERNTDDNHWLEFRAPMEMYRGVSPNLSPLAGDVVFNRFCALFFPGTPSESVAMGLAQSLRKLRPHAGNRIELLLPYAADKDRLRRLLQQAAQQYQRKEELDAQLLKAEEDLFLKKYEDVVDRLAPFAEENSLDNALYRLRGEAFLKLHRIDEAAVSYEHAIDVNPNDYVSQVGLGISELMKNKMEKGEQRLRRALELNPYYMPARINLAIRLKATRRFDELKNLTVESKKKLPADQFKEYVAALKRNPS